MFCICESGKEKYDGGEGELHKCEVNNRHRQHTSPPPLFRSHFLPLLLSTHSQICFFPRRNGLSPPIALCASKAFAQADQVKGFLESASASQLRQHIILDSSSGGFSRRRSGRAAAAEVSCDVYYAVSLPVAIARIVSRATDNHRYTSVRHAAHQLRVLHVLGGPIQSWERTAWD